MRQSSLRVRIVILLLTAQMAIAGCCIAGTLWYVRRQVRAAFESELEGRMATTLAQVHQADEKAGGVEFDGQSPATQRSGELFYVQAANGAGVAGEAGWIANARASGATANSFDFWRDGAHYRGAGWIGVRVPDQDENDKGPPPQVSVFYAMPTTAGDRSLARATEAAALIALLVLLLSALAALWAVAAGLRPLVKLAKDAGGIDVDRWAFDGEGEALRTAELAPLASALSGLVGRLRSAFERERQFVGDAAHELKTTVAIQKSTLQLVDRERLSAPEYRTGITLALEDTARTEALIARMLQLARLESGEGVNERPDAAASRLADSLLGAVTEFRSWSALKENRITLSGDFDLMVRGEADELLLVWRNLIENAIQHSPPGALVEITARPAASAGEVEVLVEDHGEGIAAGDIPHLFERFYRADRSRSRVTGGFGLGLAIARSSVARAGGAIEISSRVGQGTCARVVLKRAGPAANEAKQGEGMAGRIEREFRVEKLHRS